MKIHDWVSVTTVPQEKEMIVSFLDAAIHTLAFAGVFTMLFALYALVA